MLTLGAVQQQPLDAKTSLDSSVTIRETSLSIKILFDTTALSPFNGDSVMRCRGIGAAKEKRRTFQF
jgi:hypothetical protein